MQKYILCVIFITFIYLLYSKCDVRQVYDLNNIAYTETKFSKQYPINNDFFIMRHYPKYESFFDQFKSYRYYVLEENKKILGTFCMSYTKNKLCYMCDLKSLEKGTNLVYKLSKHLFFRYNFFTLKCFGITMLPNPAIQHIYSKYFFIIYTKLYLYQITLSIIKKYNDLFQKIFPNYFFVAGYKKLSLISSNKKIKLCHIATPEDTNYINLQSKFYPSSGYEIMFCLHEHNKYNKILNQNNISHVSEMSVIGRNCENVNWNFIRTYMI